MSQQQVEEILHDKYLPFTEGELKEHFVEKMQGDTSNLSRHTDYFKNSIGRYRQFDGVNALATGDVKTVRQIEKDERFWTVAALMTMYHSHSDIRDTGFIQMLAGAFGPTPPLASFSSWEECLAGDVQLYFEPNLPSPPCYREWLQQNLDHPIPYVREGAQNKKGENRANLEGATNVDALLINASNGFAVLIEAKVLSDISCQVSYDIKRNQIARNLDVMLHSDDTMTSPLNKRSPGNSLFMLLTPQTFKDNPHARFYGYKFREYATDPRALANDLPHRGIEELEGLGRRMVGELGGLERD